MGKKGYAIENPHIYSFGANAMAGRDGPITAKQGSGGNGNYGDFRFFNRGKTMKQCCGDSKRFEHYTDLPITSYHDLGYDDEGYKSLDGEPGSANSDKILTLHAAPPRIIIESGDTMYTWLKFKSYDGPFMMNSNPKIMGGNCSLTKSN